MGEQLSEPMKMTSIDEDDEFTGSDSETVPMRRNLSLEDVRGHPRRPRNRSLDRDTTRHSHGRTRYQEGPGGRVGGIYRSQSFTQNQHNTSRDQPRLSRSQSVRGGERRWQAPRNQGQGDFGQNQGQNGNYRGQNQGDFRGPIRGQGWDDGRGQRGDNRGQNWDRGQNQGNRGQYQGGRGQNQGGGGQYQGGQNQGGGGQYQGGGGPYQGGRGQYQGGGGPYQGGRGQNQGEEGQYQGGRGQNRGGGQYQGGRGQNQGGGGQYQGGRGQNVGNGGQNNRGPAPNQGGGRGQHQNGNNNNFNQGYEEEGPSQRRGMKMNDVNMPTGNSIKITVPATSHCECKKRAQTNLIKLQPNGKMGKREYQIVNAQMQKTVKSHQAGTPSYTIVSIEKVQNCCLWKRYRNHQRELSLDQRFVNEKMLFHGSNAVEDILKRGFDERHSNTNGMFGAGIYFAQHSSKSNQYAFGLMGGKGCKSHADKNCKSCNRKMLLCRVTLGRECKKTSGEKLSHPPPNYHSVVGTPSPLGLQYPEFVVYRGEQAYPEYVITYKVK